MSVNVFDGGGGIDGDVGKGGAEVAFEAVPVRSAEVGSGAGRKLNGFG